MKIPPGRKDRPQYHIPPAPKMKPIPEHPEIPSFILDKVTKYANNAQLVKNLHKKRCKRLTQNDLLDVMSLLKLQEKIGKNS